MRTSPEQNMSMPETELKTMRFSDVTVEEISWVWKPFIARGFLTILEGDPGQGKGLLTLDLAARLTTGGPLPPLPNTPGLVDVADQPDRQPATVVLVTSEDSRAGTEVPRAIAAGADLSRIIAVSGLEAYGRDIVVIADRLIERITQLVKYEDNIALIILDPIEEALPGLTDYNAAMARVALTTILKFAQEYDCGVLGVRHLVKGSGTSPMYRGRGSIALSAAARMVYLLGRDTADPHTRVLAPVKNNLQPLPPSLSFAIVAPAGSSTAPSIEWMGDSPLTAQDISANAGPGAAGRAELFLEEQLVEPRTLAELMEAAAPLGIAEAALWRAKTKLRVQARRDGMAKPARWLWVLPSEPENDQDRSRAKPSDRSASPPSAEDFLKARLGRVPGHIIDLSRMAKDEGITEEQFTLALETLHIINQNGTLMLPADPPSPLGA
jgi:hypothetical protein